jgi:CRISPR-associated protein Cas6
MFVRLEFSFKDQLEIPINYNYYLQSAVYKNLDKNFSDFLHNIGFEHGKRKFKLFTFSRIFSKFSIYDKKIVFESPIHFYFASIIDEVVISLISNILNKGYIRIFKRKIKFKGYKILKFDLNKEIFKTLSPITIYRTIDKKFVYFSPNDKIFSDLIFENLKKKYKLIYGFDYEGEFHFEFLNYKKEVLEYKGNYIVAYSGILKIICSNEMKNVILNCGLGSKNSLGLGMVIPSKTLNF